MQNHIQWGSKLAYAIGLIVTDGNLSPDGRHIDLTSKNIDLLETFMDCVGQKVKVGKKKSGYTGKDCFRVQIGNVELYKWLLNIGITPNKSKTIGSIGIPDNYLPDFLRGHIDGDGSFRIYQDAVYPNSQRIYTVFNSASKKHLIWLQDKINKLLGIKGSINPGKGVWKLEYAKKESLRLIPIIYYNSSVPCLKRKRETIEFILKKCRGEELNLQGFDPASS